MRCRGTGPTVRTIPRKETIREEDETETQGSEEADVLDTVAVSLLGYRPSFCSVRETKERMLPTLA